MRCEIMPPRGDTLGPTGRESCGLPHGHDGPHEAGRLLWEYDADCNCKDCQSEDPCDYCYVFREKDSSHG